MAHRMENFYITPVGITNLGILLLYINYSNHLLLEAVYNNIKVHCDNHLLFQLTSKKNIKFIDKTESEQIYDFTDVTELEVFPGKTKNEFSEFHKEISITGKEN